MSIDNLENVLEFVNYKFQKKDYYDAKYKDIGIEFYNDLPYQFGFDLIDSNYYGDCFCCVEFTFNIDETLSVVYLRTLNSCVLYNNGKIGFGYNLVHIGESSRFEISTDITYDVINDENIFQYNLVIDNISELQFMFKVLNDIINGKYTHITKSLNVELFPSYDSR